MFKLIFTAIISFLAYGCQSVDVSASPVLDSSALESPQDQRDKHKLDVNRSLATAFELMRVGEYDTASTILEEAYLLDPDNPWVQLNLGFIWQKSGQLDKAREAYLNVQNYANSDALFSGKQLGPLQSLSLRDIALHNIKSLEALIDENQDAVMVNAVHHPEIDTLVPSESELRDALTNWKQAWEAANMHDYFSMYLSSFSGKFKSHFAWRANRLSIVPNSKNIRISIGGEIIEFINSDLASITFFQSYDSLGYTDRGCKMIVFSRSSGKWLIVSETFKLGAVDPSECKSRF
jgi:tetratricopeptide (TPR) repeat protein